MWKVLRTEVVWRVNSPFKRKLSAQDQERRHEDYAPVWVVGRIDLGRRTLASGPHLVGPNLVMRRTWLDSCRLDIGDGGQRNGGDRAEKSGDTTAAAVSKDGEQTGDKRKRAVEPDGGPNVGVRGQGVPVVQASKKAKTEGES